LARLRLYQSQQDGLVLGRPRLPDVVVASHIPISYMHNTQHTGQKK
jgi:hypothetical protein